MTSRLHRLRSVVLASILVGSPALAQDRIAVFTGSGEGAEVIYVSPSDPRARSALLGVPQAKSPLVATFVASGDGIGVDYFEATSAPSDLPASAFGMAPAAMALHGGEERAARGTEAWGTGE
ncbi:hypothetical protein [Roseomonas fluvialis]|uniref:Lactonase family protein n=1 Tax=Roseomonas fluvialis TaxID=1750527 RepID=A0ABN6NVL3_9PROT|nr:hypothetical protein [Roseomonas fluvialis]BDG70479.1 hypothetical protein Rmf_04080 [Roseomonas fluvialis]